MGSHEDHQGNGFSSLQDLNIHNRAYLNRATSESTTFSVGSQLSETTDGCIVLGQDAGRGNRYVTRFRIHRDLQFKSLAEDICKEECCPCTLPSNRKNIGRCLWTAINGEPFLLLLHLSAVVFGAVKEGLSLKVVAEDLHIAASTIETYVALQILVTRIVGAWQNYHSLSKTRKKVEFVESYGTVHSPHLKQALVAFTVFGCILCLGVILCYINFFIFRHLTWTILSNNFCIILITASSGLLMGRINAELVAINDDHHKAVIYESMLLMTECVYAKKREAITSKIDRFCKALRDTDTFDKPDYIDIPNDQKLKLNLVPALQLQSFV